MIRNLRIIISSLSVLIVILIVVRLFDKNNRRARVKIGRNYVIKTYEHFLPLRFHPMYSGAIDETKALYRLRQTYRCVCGATSKHFPIIANHRSSMFSTSLVMTRCHSIEKRKGPDIQKQAYCILDNLKRAGVQHVDLWKQNSFKLLDGTITLIDFGSIIFFPPTKTFQKEWNCGRYGIMCTNVGKDTTYEKEFIKWITSRYDSDASNKTTRRIRDKGVDM